MNNYGKLLIGLAVRVFTNGPGDQGSIPGQVIPKWRNARKGVVPFPTPRCSSY